MYNRMILCMSHGYHLNIDGFLSLSPIDVIHPLEYNLFIDPHQEARANKEKGV